MGGKYNSLGYKIEKTYRAAMGEPTHAHHENSGCAVCCDGDRGHIGERNLADPDIVDSGLTALVTATYKF